MSLLNKVVALFKSERKMRDNLKVLIMDDEEIILCVASKMLEYLDCEVVTSRNGEEAINKFIESRNDNDPFDFLIFDIVINDGMDGVTTARKILEIDPSTRIIASSGYSNEAVLANYMKYGFYDILPKPYEVEQLYDKLSKIKMAG